MLGYAYRPVRHDRFNALVKYTYFYNVPTTDQVSQNGSSTEFIQKSHIALVDLTYDLTSNWSLGGKYAYRLGQVSLDRDNPDFFDNDAHLTSCAPTTASSRTGRPRSRGACSSCRISTTPQRRALGVYRYFGDNLKVGVGYNFTDFSDDLTDLSLRQPRRLLQRDRLLLTRAPD